MTTPKNVVTLGDRTGIPVVPQRHARLRNLLSAEDLQSILTAQYAAESYRVLCILIPAIDPKINPEMGIPLWEWEGYGSQEAMEAGNYVEEDDRSPTTAQIVAAFEAVIMVSGAERLGKLLGLVTNVVQTGQTAEIQTQ